MPAISVDDLRDGLVNISTPELAAEFAKLPKPDIKSSEIGKQHPEKNRYEKIQPFDDNLVRLKADDQTDMYINASYMTGFPDVKERFIACQAPIKTTIPDHWLMVYQHRVPVMVMLTKVIKDKSDRYWPTTVNGSEIYGNITVTLISKKKHTDFTDRLLSVVHDGDWHTAHRVHHLMFRSWQDMGVPDDPHPLLSFIGTAEHLAGNSKSPIVVHCSAGVGRTGTFLSIWNLRVEAKLKNSFNVFETVRALRNQRMKLVETEEQYVFVYACIIDFVSRKKLLLNHESNASK